MRNAHKSNFFRCASKGHRQWAILVFAYRILAIIQKLCVDRCELFPITANHLSICVCDMNKFEYLIFTVSKEKIFFFEEKVNVALNAT